MPPDTEPLSVTAGDTLAWTRNIPGYPASVFILKYALQIPAGSLITITASASGDTFAVNIPAATSADWVPGCYLWTSYVQDATPSRHTLERGALTILPSPLAALGTTHAQRTLALIEAALEGRIPRGLETTSIDGQELTRIPIKDLTDLRARYRAEVFVELAAARRAAGLPVRRTLGIRFVRPT